MNPDTGISQKQFEETQVDYYIMLIKKRKRIDEYKEYLKELKQRYKSNGFSLTEQDVIFVNLIDDLKKEIGIEENEYAEWTDEIIANSGK